MEIELSPFDGPSTPDIATVIADRDLLDMALGRLDPEWRAVVVLHYYLGVPLPEAATTLGIPIGTAKSRLHRSLAAMRVTIDTDMTTDLPHVTRGQYA
jgi:DNA-directed RNA polymerase specialized sigma24 family protein